MGYELTCTNYLSKYNRIKKDIQKDIILEFGI